MATMLLDDLAQRLSQQEAQLQALRRELEMRQRQLADLTQRKEHLLTQLQQIDAQIASVATGTQPVGASQPKTTPAKPSRIAMNGKHAGNGVAARQMKGKVPTKGIPSKVKAKRSVQAGRPTLPALIVTLLQEAGGPLTVKQLAEGAKRQGFRSSSGDFPRMLAVRARELKRKGILKGAVGQPGFVLAKPKQTSGQRKGATTGSATNAAGPKAKPSGKQVPLREVLTQILQKSKKPMTGSELAAHALKSGYRSKSKNFADVVWVAMGNMKNVEHVPDQGYRLKRFKT